MDHSTLELEAIVRSKLCGICSDRTAQGQCGLEQPANCALFRLFPEVARAIQSTHSDDINDYVAAIRNQVCSICGDRAKDGSCDKRTQVDCALDAYLLLVVDAIEEATSKSFDRASLVHGRTWRPPCEHPIH
jgi:hypothetical protein